MSKRKFYRLLPIFLTIILGLTLIIFTSERESLDKKREHFKPKPKIKESSLSLLMVGDALIHASLYNDAKRGTDDYDFSHMFEHIRPVVENHDLAFYNQETIIGGNHLGFSSYPCFNTPHQFADLMVEMGFNMVSLANNHSLDKGEVGIINSNNYWQTKDVLTAGTYLSDDDKFKDNIKIKNDISYSLLSYTTNTNGLKVPSGKEYLLDTFDYDKASSDIERIRDKVDLLIVSMHWGEEYTNTPTANQKEIAQFLSSLGVDIIIGHHPHVIQPIEYLDGTLVFYSLGNFISAQIGVDRLTGLMASLKVNKTENDGLVTINFSDLEATFLYTYYRNWANFKLIPFDQLTTDVLTNYEEVYNKYNKIVTSMEDSIMVTKLNKD